MQQMDAVEEEEHLRVPHMRRNYIAFWISGLTNNYNYAFLLSAALDIVVLPNQVTIFDHKPGKRPCVEYSTGTILLLNILPSLVVKSFLPFLVLPINWRIGSGIVLACLGYFLIVGARATWLRLLGLALMSISTAIGETTYLQLGIRFHIHSISAWASGTGCAGLVASVTYAVLCEVGLSPRHTMKYILIVPILEAINYLFLFALPKSSNNETGLNRESSRPNLSRTADDEDFVTFCQKIVYIKRLIKYIIPLGLVFFFEYFVNQGLFELLQFDKCFIDLGSQYRWFVCDYHLGSFLARSSISFVEVRDIRFMSFLQFLNALYILMDAIYMFTPSIWILLILVFWEGLLSGTAYVNTYFRIWVEIPRNRLAYSISVGLISDSLAITLAGALAVIAHDNICTLPAVQRP